MTTLQRIKAAVREGRYDFSVKARLEMQGDDLSEDDVIESVLAAASIRKSIVSVSPLRRERREMLHIIISSDSAGVEIYTKGKLTTYANVETYYFLVSAKKAD